MTPLIGSRVRTVFVELLKVTYPFVGYQSEPLEALVSVLSGERNYWDISSGDCLSSQQDIVAETLHDDQIFEFYFQQTIDRYPYEFLPFVTMCRILASTTSFSDDDRSELLLGLLRKTPTLTFILPDAFMDYELVQEDENTNSFCILQDIPLISLSSSWQRRTIEDDAYRIPSGTLGRFITDTGRVVVMEYPHSTLSLLGRRLEINLAKEGYRSEFGMLQPDEVAEIIALFAALVRVETIKASREEETTSLIQAENDIMHEASKHISGGRDIITVVCDTLDHYMQDELAMSDDAPVSVLNSCVQFLDAVLPIQPSRVWSYLARSELLNSESRAGKLTKITGNLDLMSERFEFLLSSIRLFSGLIDTASSSAVQRRSGNKLAPRQRSDLNPWAGTADKVLARVSLSIVQAAVDVFENTSTWKFEDASARTQLLGHVVPMLNDVVLHAYSMGSPLGEHSMVACLRPAASYIIDCFLSPNTGTLRFQPLLTTFAAAYSTAESTLYPQRLRSSRNQVVSVLSFSATLLRAADLLEKASKTFETYLFRVSTLLARLCGASDFYRSPALWLLDSLVSNGGRSSNDPPSLLGYLGPQISKSFLQVLSTVSKPFVLTDDIRSTWRFFSSVLRNRQQWMSNCLLTGQTPREAMRDTSKKELSSHSLFATALTRLKFLKTLDPSEAVVILDFVASAQNYWPWTVFTLQKDTTYLDGLRAYVRDLKPSHQVAKSDVTKASFEARIAAYVAETLAMQLYHSRHLGNGGELAKSLVMDLDYYLRDGVEVAGYNKSLHTNFAKNFASKYDGCTVESFKRTSLEPRELGPAYFYDLEKANEMLRFDPAWVGRKKDGFKTEMELANANLSLVDAQIVSFHSTIIR
jgi:nuclear pore complex protein Nup188